jgi:flagellar motility protein MotE (MotC chaperone)
MRLLLVLVFSLSAYANESAEKIYTKDDFKEKVAKEVDKQVDRLKKSSVAKLTKEILQKERDLDDRAEALALREEQIKMAEESLAKKVFEVEKQQKKLLGCVDDNEKSKIARVQQLVSVISNMKPQKAAELLSVQDSDISVKILELIKPERASKIFNLMDKEVSARLQKQYLNMTK